jgi:hypothetical protein
VFAWRAGGAWDGYVAAVETVNAVRRQRKSWIPGFAGHDEK